MATTSGDLAATVLDCVAESGGRFVVLHGEHEVAAGRTRSDVDLVTTVTARTLIGDARAHLHRHSLHPVVIWPYDVGSASVFVVDATAGDGAQLDILFDRSGTGHYGVRADAVLASARPGDRWQRAAEDDELLYLIRKRHWKGQADRLAALLADVDDPRRATLRRRADELFSAESGAVVEAALTGDAPTPRPVARARRVAVSLARITSRLVHPVGHWVAIEGPDDRAAAEELHRRFGRVLPAAGSGAVSGAAGLRAVAPVRWRAGVFCSWGRAPRWPAPDVAVAAGDPDDVARRVVAAIERRLRL